MTVRKIILLGEQVNHQNIACTGVQLNTILRCIRETTNTCRWVAFDIAVNKLSDVSISLDGLLHFTDTDELTEFVHHVDQFISGIFLAIPSGIENPQINSHHITEDEPSIELGDSILEIRTFDTSYFELYTTVNEIISTVENCFGTSNSESS